MTKYIEDFEGCGDMVLDAINRRDNTKTSVKSQKKEKILKIGDGIIEFYTEPKLSWGGKKYQILITTGNNRFILLTKEEFRDMSEQILDWIA